MCSSRRSLFVNLASMVAGFRATTGVVKAHIHREGGTATQVMDQAVDKGREFIKDKQAVVTEAVEAGRTAMQRERERLSGEKKA